MTPVVTDDFDWDSLPLRHRGRVHNRPDAVFRAHKVSASRPKDQASPQTDEPDHRHRRNPEAR